jgi:hypothetical protein
VRAPGNTRLTPRVEAERKRVKANPLVVATDTAEAYIRSHYRERDWLLGIAEQVALVGLTHGRVFADRVGFGLRCRLHLYHDDQCHYAWGRGCMCANVPGHTDAHRCLCGKVVERGLRKGVA